MVFGWLKAWAAKGRPPHWTVAVVGDLIAIDDGQGTEVAVPVSDLRRVVVATDDSGPWDADVVFLLYSEVVEPTGIFPLEAQGMQDFVAWLKALPGFHDRELAKAMSSTNVARFVVYEALA
ncbi:hypothetical protein [Caulobacter sp. BP25]|uniref:hypothetical protein n=1 Tax=Caulobacter sp. BP25 TaxID=2048900 RepID=UPI000C129B9B|nr:hypothetical protein [Caulobacter sp. BP25]PHY17536.1 hypothetical protein CSW59_18165 [Caulobacter sp. BP25]